MGKKGDTKSRKPKSDGPDPTSSSLSSAASPPIATHLTWLIFGAAEAAANTLTKIIDLKNKAFPQEERTPYTSVLIDNIIESIGKLLTLLKQQNESSIDPRVRRYLATVTRAYLFYCKIPEEQKRPKIFTRLGLVCVCVCVCVCVFVREVTF